MSNVAMYPAVKRRAGHRCADSPLTRAEMDILFFRQERRVSASPVSPAPMSEGG